MNAKNVTTTVLSGIWVTFLAWPGHADAISIPDATTSVIAQDSYGPNVGNSCMYGSTDCQYSNAFGTVTSAGSYATSDLVLKSTGPEGNIEGSATGQTGINGWSATASMSFYFVVEGPGSAPANATIPVQFTAGAFTSASAASTDQNPASASARATIGLSQASALFGSTFLANAADCRTPLVDPVTGAVSGSQDCTQLDPNTGNPLPHELSVNEIFNLPLNTLYEIDFSIDLWEAGGAAFASVDPIVQIESSFSNQNSGYYLLFSPNIPVDTSVPGQTVPEPGTLALLGLGLASLGISRRRKAA